MLYKKFTLLAIMTLLLFSCVSGGEQKEPKSTEQLQNEGRMLDSILTNFMEKNFDFKKLENLSDVESHEESHTVEGPDGGTAEISIKSKTVLDGTKKVYNFNFEATFDNYSYEGLTFNSGSLNFSAEASLTVDEEGEETPTGISMALDGEIEYSGTASGSAELKLASTLAYDSDSSIPSSEEEEQFLIIDGTEVDTTDFQFFN